MSGEGRKVLSGHYCFNLNVTERGTYGFYIWLNEANLPAGYRVYPAIENRSLIINATLIGLIMLETGEKRHHVAITSPIIRRSRSAEQ
ncbi:MAG: hypothetical protein QW145_05190 [Candidatus Bathyarchaeia archaeon]